jgi:putative intracellular protease/amidase
VNLVTGLKGSGGPADTRRVLHAENGNPDVELRSAYEAYRAAMTSWRAAAKAGNPDTTQAMADRLLEARVVLYRSLVATGWEPPAAVEVQLDRDVALVSAPTDFDALLVS